MALWWLTYRRDGDPAGVAIIEASSLIHARMRAGLDGLDAGLSPKLLFTEGHKLNDELSAKVATKEIGRLLPITTARRLIRRFER